MSTSTPEAGADLELRGIRKTFPGFTEGLAKEGYVGLQDHGYASWFRNIKIREL